MKRGKVQCNDALISYRILGQGEDVVLIHGMAANLGFWRLSLLLPIARNYRVTVFDLRGHGNSSKPSHGYTTRDLAEDLNTFLEYHQISRPHIIGHSMGGTVALHFAVLYPEKVRSLVVADARVRSVQPNNFARDWPHWEQAREKLARIGLHVPEEEPESGFWLLEKLATTEWLEKQDKLSGSSLAILFRGMNGGRRTAQKWMDLLNTTTARQDFHSTSGLTKEKLSSIDVPMLSIYGEHSPLLPSFYGFKQLAKNWSGEILTNAGHFFPYTQSERFLAIADKFLHIK